jgi:type II secretory pathway pseudopilin PulG
VVRGAAQGVQVGGGFDDAVNAAPAGLIAAASGMLVSARQQAQRNSRLSEQLSSSEAAIQTVAAQYAQVLADARVLALLVSHLVGASAPGGKLASLLGRYLPDGFNPSPGVDGAGSKPAAGNNSVEHFGGDA